MPYKMIPSYKFVDRCIDEGLANEDYYWASHDMDEFRIRIGYNSRADRYMLIAFEDTAYEKQWDKLTLSECWDKAQSVLDQIANIG